MSTKTEEIKEETKPKKEKAPKEEKGDSSKKKKTYTVEELLGQGERMELFDEYGKKKKIKVKIQEGKLKKRENRMGYFFIIPYVVGVLLCLAYPLILSAIYSFHFVRLLPGGGTDLQFKGIQNFTRVFEKNITRVLFRSF